ncbi:AAA family ATPase [Haloferula chungangensis]|uniref:AAA family ATPase n=1 Tax=Haloferula chungangensis TaxID=1048331 RepID=A0ABW2L7E9_9BACT
MPESRAAIVVLAGVNGAGKSSIAGATLRANGGEYFNPDEAARHYRDARPELSQEQANAWAWRMGKERLEVAIAENLAFNFETTLGGNSIADLLLKAAIGGTPVRVFYVGLDSPEKHIERVRQRVARGGHDIPESKIRERWERSLLNLIRLIPYLAELRVFDNSIEADPAKGQTPQPLFLLSMRNGAAVEMAEPKKVPVWAKPILAAALRL